MFDSFALITNNMYWKVHSVIIKLILTMYGIKVGSNFYIEGIVKLKIRGKANNIIIGDDVKIFGNIDLRNRRDGKIFIGNMCSFENDVRLVTGNQGIIKIGQNSGIGAYTIINGGGSVSIGNNVMIASNISINASEHIFNKDKIIRESGYIYADVNIEDDVWIASNSTVTKGVYLKVGTVVAANSVINKNTEPHCIYGGVPAKKIGERK